MRSLRFAKRTARIITLNPNRGGRTGGKKRVPRHWDCDRKRERTIAMSDREDVWWGGRGFRGCELKWEGCSSKQPLWRTRNRCQSILTDESASRLRCHRRKNWPRRAKRSVLKRKLLAASKLANRHRTAGNISGIIGKKVYKINILKIYSNSRHLPYTLPKWKRIKPSKENSNSCITYVKVK